MRSRARAVIAVVTLTVTNIVSAQVPGLINYQGRLVEGTNLVNGSREIVFRLYSDPSGGTPLYEETQTVVVADGLYAVCIGASNTVPNGLHNALGNTPCFLEVEIEGQVLSPRERIASVAYAHYAAAVENGAITEAMLADDAVSAAKIASGAVGEDELAVGSVSADKLADNAVTGGKIADGSLSNADLAAGAIDSRAIADRSISNVDVAANTFWQTTGNTGTIPGTNFIGTTDLQPLEFRVRNYRALRLESDGTVFMNVIGGSSHNVVSNEVIGATVFGGGASNSWAPPNIIGRIYGTACGGAGNKVLGHFAVIAGGFGNTADGFASVISGGYLNSTTNDYGTVAGGELNTVGWWGSVGGGQNNTAGLYGAVSGGRNNTAYNYSAVPGGFGNLADGSYSIAAGGYSNEARRDFAFAAGRRAKANHIGAFVWADSTNEDFQSTANNQFLIRASGGVGIGTNVTPEQLTVAGNVKANTFIGSGAGLTGISGTSLVANTVGPTHLSDGASLVEILDDDGPGSGLDADLLDGYHAGNVSNAVAVNNGVLNMNLNADLLDGRHAGNASNAVPVSNGTINEGLNADMLDGWHAGNASNAVPINNGVLNTNLNADMLDGIHAASFPRIYASGVVQSGSTNITIPHYRPFTLELASGHPYAGGVAHVTGCENDSQVGIVYTRFNGEGYGSGYGGTNGSLWSTNVLLFFGSTAYTNEVRCPGDGSRTLVLRHAGTAELLYKLSY